MIEDLIIQACKRKERLAFKQCYKSCAPYVFTIIKNYISDADDRKDVMQEVFAHIFNAIHQYDPSKASFKTWISRITINQTINFIKRNKKMSLLVPLNEEYDTASELPNIDIQKVDKKIFQHIVDKMPSGYRTVFLLNFVDGYAHDEIAQIMGISIQTSRSQLSRALKWLRSNYKDQLNQLNYG